MSNLGAYQWITSASKKVGGPVKLLAIVSATSMLVYKGCELGLKKAISGVKNKKNNEKEKNKVYKVLSCGESNEGLKFYPGDKFKVLEEDGNAVLIEKIGDNNNPYFVDKKLLAEISRYGE